MACTVLVPILQSLPVSCSLEPLGWLVVARWPAPLLSWAALPRQQATFDILHCTSFAFETLPVESSGCGDRLKLVLNHGNERPRAFHSFRDHSNSGFSEPFERVLSTSGHLLSPSVTLCHLVTFVLETRLSPTSSLS